MYKIHINLIEEYVNAMIINGFLSLKNKISHMNSPFLNPSSRPHPSPPWATLDMTPDEKLRVHSPKLVEDPAGFFRGCGVVH
jgi:hypothetical protein